MPSELSEKEDSLFALAAAPLIWVAHLLLSYCTAAIWCVKVGEPFSVVRWAIAAYTAIALAGVAFVGVRGYRRHRFGSGELPHAGDTRADRHRFIGFATLLLAGLSGIAIVYEALPALFLGSCR